MFFYKLKKVIKEKLWECVKSSVVLSFIASFIPFFPFLFLYTDDFSRKEKKQMFFVSFLCVIINLLMINWVDYTFGMNIIMSILCGAGFSFLFFFVPCFILMFYFEYTELVLDKDEIREAKLNSLLRKLF